MSDTGAAPEFVPPTDAALTDDASASSGEGVVTVPPPPELARGQVLFRTLGAAELHIGGIGVIGPGSERMFSLLAVCAMEPEHAMARARLLELVWPDMDDESGRHSLRQHTYRLRQYGIGLESTRASVVIDRASLVPCFALDRSAALFERDVLRGHEPFGHLFAGWVPSHAGLRDWLEGQRDAYHMDVRRVLIPELRLLRDRGQWEECERWARTVLEFDSFNEDATVILAEAVAMMGSRASAKGMLDLYVRETASAGTELGRRIEQAQQRIVRAGRVSYDGSAAITLVGRDDVMARLDKLTLQSLNGHAQVVRVSGPAGIGKTEVAHEATRRAVILGFSRCIVRVSRSVGQITHGTLSRMTRDLLNLPGSLGVRPPNLRLLRQFAGLEPATPLLDLETLGTPSPLTECLIELITSIAEERPLFLFVDDLHYVDRQSLEEFERLADLLQRQQVVFLTTERDGEGDMLRLPNATSRTIQIQLQRLSLEEREELAANVQTISGRRLDRSMAREIARAGAHTPLEVITLAREQLHSGMSTRVQGKLRDSLHRQIARFTDAPRALLAVLSLLGGKASIEELGGLLQLGIVERSSALRTVLESGLVEASVEQIHCHDEVAEAIRAVISAAEFSLIRRHVTDSLLERLRAQFVSERAVDALSLASDSGDAGLFVDAVLEFAPRIADAGLLRGAMKFVELAEEKSAEVGKKPALLECLVRTADKASDWHTVLQGARLLRDLNSDSVPLDADVALSELEAALQSDLQLEGRAKAGQALLLARAQAVTPEQRIRALRLVISAASDLFAADLAVSAYSLLPESEKLQKAASAASLEPQMQFHMIFGDLNVARSIADGIFQDRETLVHHPEGVRLLHNASHVLRVCGDLLRSRECMELVTTPESFAESPIRMGMAFWRLSLIETDAGNVPKAIEWGEKLFALSEGTHDFSQLSWAMLYRLRIEQLRDGVIQDAELALGHALRPTDSPTRLQVYATALSLHSAQLDSDEHRLSSLLNRSMRYLEDYGRYTGMDYLAMSLAESCDKRNSIGLAAPTLEGYFARSRRGRAQLSLTPYRLTEATQRLILDSLAKRTERTGSTS